MIARPRHGGRGRLWRGLSVPAVLVFAVIFLPTIVSLGPVQRLILGKAGDLAGVALSAGDCALGWVGGIRVKNLAVRDPGGFSLRAEEISVSSGLLRLIGRRADVGVVRIVSPTVSVPLPEPPPATPAPPVEPAPSAPAGARSLRVPGIDLRGRVEIVGGRVEFARPGAPPEFTAAEISLDLRADSLAEPLRLTGRMGREASVEAEVRLVPEAGSAPGRLAGRLAVRVSRLDLAPFGGLARQYAPLPEVRGVLSGEVDAALSGGGEWTARGKLDAAGLGLRGHGLRGDEPEIEALSVDFDVARRSNAVVVSRCALTSALVAAQISGALDATGATDFPSGMLTATARVDVAALAAQIPDTLAVRDDATLRSGEMLMHASLGGDGTRLSLRGRAETRDIEAVHGERVIAMEEPLRVAVDAQMTREGPVLERLELASSFARVSGAGDLGQASLTGSLDLQKALREAAKFVDLKGITATGTVEVSALLGGLARQERRIAVNAAARDLSIAGLTPGLIANAALLVRLAGVLRLTASGAPEAFTEVSGAVESDVLNAELGAVRLAPAPASGGLPSVTAGRLRIVSRLEDIARFAGAAAATNITPDVRGTLTVEATVDAEADVLTIPTFRADVTNLVIEKAGRTFAQPRAGLSASGRLYPSRGDLVLDTLALSSDLLNLAGAGSVEDIRNDRLLHLAGVTECDVGRVAELLTVFGQSGIRMRGRAPRPFQARVSLAGRGVRELLAGAEAEAGVFIEQAELFGIALSKLEPRLVVGHSVATLKAEADVNGGRLSMAPFVDARDETAVLAMPEGSQVLRDVRLTDEMASELLGLLHPLFKGCTVLGGRIGLLLEECRVPIEDDFRRGMNIGGAINLREVRVKPGYMLTRVFEIISLQGAAAVVPDQDVKFVCRAGRVKATPLKIVSGPYQITVSGTVGVDGSLDYVAEVPVTEGMVNADVYRYVADARLKVIIRGTVTEPEISRRSLDESLGELLRQAAQKALLDEKARKALIDQGSKVLDELLKDRRIRF